ncbi:helix-turn-helix domain-containing protein [Rubellimicrobium roseum]|uniref:Helix-turn-helix domain-containing protein n=1 Tax=Rubellimicrobium roseum TaxID=687525 RepID=A0A5C4NFA5_9RHOB|nr:helix-turn-helix domain-containing protein [Rubellimicrobium roseum]
MPGWVPEAAAHYLAHTEKGQGIRALAREARVAPSTVSRRVRRVESLRDDPLVDSALESLTAGGTEREDEEALAREALPVLRRLAESGTVLAVARDMEKGVLVRDVPDGEPTRLAVVERRLAEAMALRDWIGGGLPEARIQRYRISPAGRALLRRMVDGGRPAGFAEAQAGFAFESEDARLRHARSMLGESPLLILSRRRDGDGRPFLPRDLIAAGERLREDFEIAQEAEVAADWEGWLLRVPRIDEVPRPLTAGPEAARRRIERALADLGPGLADVALRCCCLLEGLEQVERRHGWSARSGKVVLRIALERLQQHYRAEAGVIG